MPSQLKYKVSIEVPPSKEDPARWGIKDFFHLEPNDDGTVTVVAPCGEDQVIFDMDTLIEALEALKDTKAEFEKWRRERNLL